MVSISGGFSPVANNLLLSSVTNSAGGNNGGYEVTIVGTGFPSDKKLITFTLCGQYCTITSINNIEAKIMVPGCSNIGASDIQASYNSLTASIGFTYNTVANAVTVSAISPNSWSPVLKGVMSITGTGFGTDPSLLRVFLSNSTGNVYELKVLSATDTLIKTGIPGGLPGNFDVNVIKSGFGSAFTSSPTANDFVYEVVIDSVSPTTGSYEGGTLLTITGRNFVPDEIETMVMIGNELNQICKIESIT